MFTVTGKKIPRGKTSKTDKQCSNDGNDDVAKTQAEKSTAKMKKSAKPFTSTNTEQEEPVTSVKRKPSKIQPVLEAGGSEPTGSSSANPTKPNKGRRGVKNKKQAEKQDHVTEVQNHTEPTPDPAEQPEVQSTSKGTAIIL